jgi:hypothetical protein
MYLICVAYIPQLHPSHPLWVFPLKTRQNPTHLLLHAYTNTPAPTRLLMPEHAPPLAVLPLQTR